MKGRKGFYQTRIRAIKDRVLLMELNKAIPRRLLQRR
jgi:hypothetical protein